LFLVNFKPGTFLIGWDNTLPELNFFLNLKRNFFASWQEYRGLGLFDNMAHAANLVHTLFLFIFSLILPVNLLRYFFHFLMHFLGGVGIYYLMLFLLKKKAKKQALITSLFYLLNIGTLQMFYAPLEVFSIHFCALPWLSLFLIKFLKKGKRKDLFWFFVLSLLFSSQAFVPPLFIVYLLSVLVILVFTPKVARRFKKILTTLVLIFSLNAFWLLPYGLSVLQGAGTVVESKVNQMSNENILLNNKEFGDFKSVSLIHGFSLKYTDLDKDGKTKYMMKDWRQHLERPLVLAISWLFFGLVLVGIFHSLIKQRKEFYPFLVLLMIGFLMLANDIPFISFPFNFLAQYVPFFSAGFRFVFTKFSLLYVFAYSLFLGLGIHFIFILISRLKVKRYLFSLLLMGCFLLLIYYSWTAFKGSFFYPNLRVKIPEEYFQLTEYFKGQDHNARLAILPQPEFWGWTYYSWGFRGSGFIWQALPQASMDGAFLPWSAANENFYWQISQAIQSHNQEQFESLLEKYQISWLVLDKSIRGTADYQALHLEEIGEMLNDSTKIGLAKEFDPPAGGIQVYQVNLQTPVKDFVFLASDLPQVNSYSWNNEDTAFQDYGHYQSIDYLINAPTASVGANQLLNQPSIYYPFRSLFTGRQQDELEFEVRESFNSFIFSSPSIASITNYSLLIPPLNEVEGVFWTIDLQEQPLATPSVEIKDNQVEVRLDKTKGYFTYDSLDDERFLTQEVRSCNPFNVGEIKRKQVGAGIRFESLSSSNCIDIDLSSLIQEKAYLVKVASQNLEGKSLLFKVFNQTVKSTVIETDLPQDKPVSWFIIPPQEKYGQGYTLFFDNISIGRPASPSASSLTRRDGSQGGQKTINQLDRVEVYPIPYHFLKSIKLTTNQLLNTRPNQLSVNDVKHPNPSFYKIQLDSTQYTLRPTPYLILSQSFHSGWLAFYFQGLKPVFLKDHVLVNNWQNGWNLNNETMKQWNNEAIYLLFWPQFLEYLGFIFLGVFILFLFFPRKTPRKKTKK